jgi:hypothetical protein
MESSLDIDAMSLNELWTLHEEVVVALTNRLKGDVRLLDARLDALSAKQIVRTRSYRRREK